MEIKLLYVHLKYTVHMVLSHSKWLLKRNYADRTVDHKKEKEKDSE